MIKLDKTKMIIVQKGHLKIFEKANYVRETKTQYILKVKGFEMKFFKESGKEVGKKDIWDGWHLLEQNEYSEKHYKHSKLTNELQEKTKRVHELSFYTGHYSVDELEQISKLIDNSLNILRKE